MTDLPNTEHMNPADLHDHATKACELLKAMANEHRLLVLCMLSQGERSVSELERLTGSSQSTLSQHLGRLRRQGLVQTRRQAQTIYYSLAGKEAAAIITTLFELFCVESQEKSEFQLILANQG